jgi:hypothetical protein
MKPLLTERRKQVAFPIAIATILAICCSLTFSQKCTDCSSRQFNVRLITTTVMIITIILFPPRLGR